MKRLYDARPSNIRPFMDRMKLHISELDLPNVPPVVFQRVFAYHRSQYSRYSAIYTDGSKRADYVGCGVVIEDIMHGYRLDTSCSIFTAEAVAIYRALQLIDSTMPRKYCIYTDSMSVLEALECYHDRCHPVVCTILDITSRLYSKGFDIVFCWLPSHVGIIGNEQADSAAKSAKTHLPLAVPLSDMKRVIMHHIFKIWQESWSQQLDNKLHSVKPVTGAWPVMPMRRTDVKLTRLRIGHTRFTHRHLLFGERAPESKHEIGRNGQNDRLLLVKLNVPLFRIPASEKELEKIILRVKNRVSDPPAEKKNEEKKPKAVSPPPPTSPRSKGRKAKRSVDADGFAPPPPPSNLFEKFALLARPPPPSPTPSSAPIMDSATLEEQGEEGMDTIIDVPQSQEEVPVATKKPRIPPFFVSPKGDWRQLVALAKLIAPSFQSQMSGRFLKVTVADDVDYRALSKWLESSGVEFKSFMLKQDRPVKVVIRGLPSNTEPEDIKTEIEAEGFKVLKISQMKNYRTKAPMPLFYLIIENGADAPKIYDFTELFGTRIEVKPFDRGNKVNQCWRCQGWFHSSEVCHLPPRCVKCAGPHAAKDCTLEFEAPMKCANCSGAHAANWSRCPKHPNNSKRKNQNKNKNGPKPNNNLNKNNVNNKQPAQAPRPDISKARKVSPNLDYSKVVQNKIPKEHVSPPSTSKSELRPAPSKDASINAGLLKDLLEVIEESPSIDKQTFCRVFKNSLSALRSASADVDKTYVIFEAYCRLRSLQA
ncbi:nucleic-acid-binding protein from transposon X-element [Trichonephila clavipes]|uniref:Nucleic-acid-binding protein from transposon X-element n=1 Tax=Trichonephila clavipes TaxID=2585209 RepID=A0A8X6WCX9_TRICX|nr:nucleic-acid-binding protein from transposon X-element [Trichonephila clavipes]